jgi:cellulose synthase/poly-beta-1,6-N-acetylglucosamine synthase-like glycosyltransferase
MLDNGNKVFSAKFLLTICVLLCCATILRSWWEEVAAVESPLKPVVPSKHFLGRKAQAASVEVSDEDDNALKWACLICSTIVLVCNVTISVPAVLVALGKAQSSVSAEALFAKRDAASTPNIDAIVPCYLPNEQDIIEETVLHILDNVKAPGDLKVWVVYNTPQDMPIVEDRLQELSRRLYKDGRSLVVVRAVASKSKAENINFVVPQIQSEYAVLYDADHHPDPDSLMHLLRTMVSKNSDCVWGSTYIRNLTAGFLARIIDAEFFVTHFMVFPSLQRFTGSGIFGGSNGLWRTEVLKTNEFSATMQTEDIDFSMRVLLQGHRIDICPESRSGELAPNSLTALYRQRLRWAMGWDEISFKRFSDICTASTPARLAVAYICYSRWLLQLAGLLACVLLPSVNLVRANAEQFIAFEVMMFCSWGLWFAFALCCTSEAILQVRHRGRQSWLQIVFVMIFLLLGPAFVLFNATLIGVSIWRNCTGTIGSWAVTSRGPQKVEKLDSLSKQVPHVQSWPSLGEYDLTDAPESASTREPSEIEGSSACSSDDEDEFQRRAVDISV